MDWKFIMCLLVMCSTTVWKLLEILTYGEIQVRQVDDIMMMYMTFTIYAAYKAGMAVQAKRQKQTEEKIATTSDKQKRRMTLCISCKTSIICTVSRL